MTKFDFNPSGEIIFFGRFLLVLIFLISCVTTRRPSGPFSLPVVYQPLFNHCSPLDGDATLIVKKDDATLFSSAMVWTVNAQNDAEFQFNSPVGDTIFQLSRKNRRWMVSGSVDLSISENDHGVLMIDGHELPLLSEELGCVLSGAWPASWLSFLDLETRGSENLALRGQTGSREIFVNLTLPGISSLTSASDTGTCAVIKWGGFLGLWRRTLNICREKIRSEVKMKMSGINNYEIDWDITHE